MSKPVFNARNLITLVHEDFSANTLQIAEHFGISKELAYKGTKALSPLVFCGDLLDGGEKFGPMDNIPKNRRKFPVLWQCNETYDSVDLQHNLDKAIEGGVDLDREIT